MSETGLPTATQAPAAAASSPVALAVQVGMPAAAAAFAEGLLTSAFATGRIGWPIVIAVHVAIVVLLVVWALQIGASGGNGALPLLTAIAVAAAGPIGAVAALLTIVLVAPRGEDQRRLDDWYERIALAGESDDVTRLCEQVTTGRTTALTGESPASFAAIMERGSLDDRQAALGIIARNFHTDYLPVLLLALKSPEPVIRVQAAAVATRVRGELRALIDRLAGVGSAMGDATSPRHLASAAQLEAAVASGLLDEGDRIRAGVLIARFKTRDRDNRHHSLALVPAPILDRRAVEEELLRDGRFAALRAGRRIAAVADAGMFRVRRPGRAANPTRA